jgi:peptidoglycan/LPS O-acetylase OafA/YrhL
MSTETTDVTAQDTAELPPPSVELRAVTTSDSGREHLPFVDAVRVVALVVLSLSYLVALAPAAFGGAGSLAARIFGAGSHGVELFFALSSFCLAYPALLVVRLEHSVGFDVARYAAKRIARILLPYYVALALLALIPLVAARFGHPFALGEPFAASDLLKQLLFLDHDTKFINPALWTLCLQVRWYVLFPFALALWIKSPRAFGVVVLGAVAVSLFTETRSVDLAYLPAFMLGIVCADAYLRPLPFKRYAAVLAPLCIALAVVLEVFVPALTSFRFTIAPGFPFTTSIFWQVAAFMIILGAGETAELDRFFAAPFFRIVARIAFSAVLVAEPVFVAVLHALRGHFLNPLPLTMALAAAAAASLAFWQLAEYALETTGFREKIIDFLSPRFARAVSLVGIPNLMIFEDALLQTEANQAAAAAPPTGASGGSALLQQHVDHTAQRNSATSGAQRNSATPGASRKRPSTARTVRAGTLTPISTSPRARGTTKRSLPSRVFLSALMAASIAAGSSTGPIMGSRNKARSESTRRCSVAEKRPVRNASRPAARKPTATALPWETR